MGIPTSEVGYTSATTRRGDHEVHEGHVVALDKQINNFNGIKRIAAISDIVLLIANKNRNKITHVGQNCVCKQGDH
jgi:hypothetical protein